MGRVELHERWFGDGLSGTVEIEPALTWMDRHALHAAADSAAATLGAILGFRVEIAHALGRLTDEVGLRLDVQATILAQQAESLSGIHATLKTPLETRAAERIAQTAELLRRRRFDRALEVAEGAIEDDPNNPGGFEAAAWASLGLRRGEDARRHFIEAAEASDGDRRARSLRHAARLTYVLEGAHHALACLGAVSSHDLSPLEQRAVALDVASYQAEDGDIASASDTLRAAYDGDERFALMTLADPVLAQHEPLVEQARTYLADLDATIAQLNADTNAALTQAADMLAEPRFEDPISEHVPAGWAERRRELQQARVNLVDAAASPREERSLIDEVAESRARNARARELTAAAATWLSELPSVREIAEQAARREAAQRAAERDEEHQRSLAKELEQAVLVFARVENAWPRILKDGTWTIERKRRLGATAAWRGAIVDGVPRIDPV